MAELVDPAKLVSVAQVAKSYGYHPKYFSKLASLGKFKAWRIGTFWVSTRDAIDEYVRTAPPPGPRKSLPKKKQK